MLNNSRNSINFAFFYNMRKIYAIILICSFTCVNAFASDQIIRRQAVKATILSWYTGSCKLSYERAVLSNQTMEITAGYIGVGHDKFNNHPKGLTARYAHKYIFHGNDIQPLNGFYLRPELIYSYFHYYTKINHYRKVSEMGSALFTVGYQYAMHRIVADFFIGGGYAFGQEADTHYQHGFALWDNMGTYNKNISLTFGLKIGVSF